MFRRAAHGLGIAIDNAARAVYRKALGLRIPAARIRLAADAGDDRLRGDRRGALGAPGGIESAGRAAERCW